MEAQHSKNVPPVKAPAETPISKSTVPFNVTVSSKGRRIIPPLCYWEGERIVSNQTAMLYTPGNLEDCISLPSYECPRPAKHVEKVTKKKSKHTSLTSRLEEAEVFNISCEDSNTIAGVPEESVKTKTSNPKRLKSNKHKGSVIKNKTIAMQQALCSNDSNDVENVPLEKGHKVKSNHKKHHFHRDKTNKWDH